MYFSNKLVMNPLLKDIWSVSRYYFKVKLDKNKKFSVESLFLNKFLVQSLRDDLPQDIFWNKKHPMA